MQPLIPLADHYDGVHDRRSACRDLHNVILHGDHHHDVGGDPSEKHEKHHPLTADQLLQSLRMSLQP